MTTDISVVRGQPTAEELAAVVVVLAARTRASGQQESPGRRSSLWAARTTQMRPPVVPGPGAWRASGLPG